MSVETAVHKVARERFRLAIILTALILIIYCWFILPVAFDREPRSILLNLAFGLDILLGALVIVSAWILFFIYVQWANNHYNRIIAEAARAPVGASWEEVNVSRRLDRITDTPLVGGRLTC